MSWCIPLRKVDKNPTESTLFPWNAMKISVTSPFFSWVFHEVCLQSGGSTCALLVGWCLHREWFLGSGSWWKFDAVRIAKVNTWRIPSGNLTKSYGTWAVYSGFTHWKSWFSIVICSLKPLQRSFLIRASRWQHHDCTTDLRPMARVARHFSMDLALDLQSPIFPGWWFGTFFIFHFIYGMSSFPLTNSYFSEG